jgi:hypothetical protein
MSNFDARKNEKRMKWLARNAQIMNVRAEQEHSSDVWQKAVQNGAVDVRRAKGQAHLAVGSFTGETPTDFDGEGCQFYHLYMARTGDPFEDATFVGACTCPAFRHDETRPCKHICRAVQYDELEKDVMTVSRSIVREIRETDDGGERSTGATTILDDDSGTTDNTIEDVESQMRICPTHRRERHVRGDDGTWRCVECQADGETGSDGGETESQVTPDDGTAPQPAVAADGSVPAETHPEDDAFANPLPDVDKKYVIQMDGEQYIRKAGYARLLRQQGWRVLSTEIVGAHETDWTRAKYRAVILDEDEQTLAQSVGTAGPPDMEDMADAEMHLDELAETRAWTRAASIATGEGMTALAEVHPDQSDVGGGR